MGLIFNKEEKIKIHLHRGWKASDDLEREAQKIAHLFEFCYVGEYQPSLLELLETSYIPSLIVKGQTLFGEVCRLYLQEMIREYKKSIDDITNQLSEKHPELRDVFMSEVRDYIIE